MKSILFMSAIILLSSVVMHAQIKNLKTETVKVSGNCGMCESTIEKAGTKKKFYKTDWDVDTKMATISYDAQKTNVDEVLKQIALAGYDNAKYRADDKAYSNLPGCCQYDREPQVASQNDAGKNLNDPLINVKNNTNTESVHQEVNQLQVLFDQYFELKDALVKTDGTVASVKAAALSKSLNLIKMETLKKEEHNVWMQVEKELKTDAEHIADTKDIEHQRDHFMSLSKNMYKLIKISKHSDPVYYQFCPMANEGKGANWLSKENAIKNPYYGTKMLTCGKTVETINQ